MGQGMVVGLFVGGISVITVGPAPGKTFMGTVGGHMLQTGGWLGAVLSIGSVIRGEEKLPHPFIRQHQWRQMPVSRVAIQFK
ncbi:hypothetical protein HDV03_005400 [Kappamyces sp. JEL0829]|nr:hypothetical protein HDV03_005400 [Kappamyces sp. JEL0829]